MQTYIWRCVSLVVNFLSFLVVVPYLSSNPQLYGIYTFCISFQLYLSYADIGFLSAGQKYAAEAFARGDRQEEINIFGFVAAVLLVMILPFSLLMIGMAINPDWAINGVLEENKPLVSTLFWILAIVTPIQMLLQRLVQSILTIRVKDFVAARVDVIGSVIKILSVFYFFTGGRYMLAEYFLFTNSVTIICAIIIIEIIKKKENYNIGALVKSVKFSKKYFDLMKRLSFTALGATVSWVICYELDPIIIGKVFSVNEVSLYAVCFTLINYVRHFLNIIYGPYAQRFNHFVALNQSNDLREMLFGIVKYTFPICLFICAIMSFSSKYLILLWVGENYEDSIPLLVILSWFFIFHFISQPGNNLCIATKRYMTLNLKSILLPFSFIGSFVIMSLMGIGYVSFAYAKIIMVVVSFLIMRREVVKWISISDAIKPFIPLVLVIIVLGLVSHFLYPLLFPQPSKNIVMLIELVLLCCAFLAVYFGFMVLFDSNVRKKIKVIIKK